MKAYGDKKWDDQGCPWCPLGAGGLNLYQAKSAEKQVQFRVCAQKFA